MNRLQEIELRLAEISGEIEQRGESITADDLTAFEDEVTALKEERTGLLETAEKRTALLANIATGQTGGTLIAQKGFIRPEESNSDDPFDSMQYKKAFMEFVCRGTPIPAEFRKAPLAIEYRNDITTTGDAGAVIPTTILNELIKKMESYGSIYSQVRKLNIQGGVSVPILGLRPVATWIGETTVSPDQQLEAKESVQFSYYGLECRIAQTLLASVVTLEMFQRQFVALAVEAIVKALEIAIFRGTGNGQMLGILNDTRIPAANSITMGSNEINSWEKWMKKVFAKMKKSYRNGQFIMAQGTFDGYINGMVDLTGQPIARVNYGITGGETYRFGGKRVETVEDDVITPYQDAATGDVVAVFTRLPDYAINTNMQMRVVRWRDNDNNQIKNKAILIADGKLLAPFGTLLIKKGA